MLAVSHGSKRLETSHTVSHLAPASTMSCVPQSGTALQGSVLLSTHFTISSMHLFSLQAEHPLACSDFLGLNTHHHDIHSESPPIFCTEARQPPDEKRKWTTSSLKQSALRPLRISKVEDVLLVELPCCIATCCFRPFKPRKTLKSRGQHPSLQYLVARHFP